MKIFISFPLIALLALASACSNDNPSLPSVANVLQTMSGTWRATSASSTVGPCTSTTYTVTPTGTNTANVTFGATCAGVAVSGNGNGTLNGNTLNWATSGNAGACTFALTGTAVPSTGASDLNITYGGTVCNAPVSGSDTLHR